MTGNLAAVEVGGPLFQIDAPGLGVVFVVEQRAAPEIECAAVDMDKAPVGLAGDVTAVDGVLRLLFSSTLIGPLALSG